MKKLLIALAVILLILPAFGNLRYSYDFLAADETVDDNTTSVHGTGFAAYTTGGTVQEATHLEVHSHRKFAIQDDIGSSSGGNLVSLTATNTIEMYIKGVTDATNFTFDCLTVRIVRIN
jgi:hypothetical protein